MALVDSIFNKSDIISLLENVLEEHNAKNEKKFYISSLFNIKIPSISMKGLNEEQLSSNVTVVNRVSSFKLELIAFLTALTEDEIEELLNRFEEGIIPLDSNLIENLANVFCEEYKTVYIRAIIEENAHKKRKKEEESVNLAYGKNSYIAQANATTSIVEETLDYMEALANSNPETAPKNDLQAVIYKLKSEISSVKIGEMLESLYEEIEKSKQINTDQGIGYVMRVNAILSFVKPRTYLSLASYMFNEYNWMTKADGEYNVLSTVEIADKIKDRFKDIIYTKEPNNKIGQSGQFSEEYSDTGATAYKLESDNVNYGNVFLTGDFVDNVVTALEKADQKEYKRMARRIGNILAYSECCSDEETEFLIIERMMYQACGLFSDEMCDYLSIKVPYKNQYLNPNTVPKMLMDRFRLRLSKLRTEKYQKRIENMFSTIDEIRLSPKMIHQSYLESLEDWNNLSEEEKSLRPKPSLDSFILEAVKDEAMGHELFLRQNKSL